MRKSIIRECVNLRKKNNLPLDKTDNYVKMIQMRTTKWEYTTHIKPSPANELLKNRANKSNANDVLVTVNF